PASSSTSCRSGERCFRSSSWARRSTSTTRSRYPWSWAASCLRRQAAIVRKPGARACPAKEDMYHGGCPQKTKPGVRPGSGLVSIGSDGSSCGFFLLGFLVVGLGAALGALVEIDLDEPDRLGFRHAVDGGDLA